MTNMESTVITPEEKDKKESEIICFSGLKNKNPPPKKKKKKKKTHTHTPPPPLVYVHYIL